MKPTITEGIIAVANHKLRVEGIESYKNFLAEEYFSMEEVLDFLEERIDHWTPYRPVTDGPEAKAVRDELGLIYEKFEGDENENNN